MYRKLEQPCCNYVMSILCPLIWLIYLQPKISGDKSPLSPYGPLGLLVMRKMCILLFCSHAFLHSISFPRPLCRIYLQNIPMNILIWSDTIKLNSYTNSTHKQNTISKAGKEEILKRLTVSRKINKLSTNIYLVHLIGTTNTNLEFLQRNFCLFTF